MMIQIQQLMQQCLADPSTKRAKLYGLALLRTVHDPEIVARIVNDGKPTSSSMRVLRAVYADYSSIFTDLNHQYLHPEIQDFLRHHLLQRRSEPEIYTLIVNIYRNQQERFHEIDQPQIYPDLHARLGDVVWIEAFLDLLEAQFWVDPAIGIRYAIPFVLAASLYHPHFIHDVVNICAFFVHEIASPQREYWSDMCQCFNLLEQAPQPQDKLDAIQNLKKLVKQDKYFFASLFENYHQQLFAALQWQTGELYRELNLLRDAVTYYLEALPALYVEEQRSVYTARLYRFLARTIPDENIPARDLILKEAFLLKAIEYQPDVADTYCSLGNVYFELKKYESAIANYQYAIELQPHCFEAWTNLGVIYTKVKKYQRALDELNYAEQFNENCAQLFYFRGNVYRELQRYPEALNDFTRAVELDPDYTEAYTNRGNIYAMLNFPEQAKQDYEQTISIDPDNVLALWLREWIGFGKQKVKQMPVVAQRLANIAAHDSHHYLASVCSGIAHGFTQRNIKQALPALEESCRAAPDEWDGYFWLAMVEAYCHHPTQAEAALCDAIGCGLPTALLSPLFWLEKDYPDFFYNTVLPLLRKYTLYRMIL